MQRPFSRSLSWITLTLTLLACAKGASLNDELSSLKPDSEPEQTASETLPPAAAPVSGNASSTSSSSSSGNASTTHDASSSASSSSSSSSSGSPVPDASTSSSSSSSSSSGATGGGACPTSDLSYYFKAIDELSKPTPNDCSSCTDPTVCCYGDLVCVPL